MLKITKITYKFVRRGKLANTSKCLKSNSLLLRELVKQKSENR